MPRTEEAYQHIRMERKAQILQAAAHLFAHKGLAATTITDIAAAASVSHGLLYRHFTSKEEVFAAVVEEALSAASLLAKAALAQSGTPWDRLHWITSHMLAGDHGEKRPDYSLVVLHALTNEGVPVQVRERAAKQGTVIYVAIRQLIVDGQAIGQIESGDTDQLATVFLACIQGLSLRAMFMHEIKASFPSADTVLAILRKTI